MNTFKKLLPSLLIIAIYFIADETFGPVIGMWCALALGIAELLYTLIREKFFDKMLLLTTLFFCIPGLLTLLVHDGTIIKLQPAIVETALCVLLGIFAFSKADISSTLPASVRKQIHVSEEQQQTMRNTIKILFFTLCVHTLLSFYALLFFEEKAASFITGPLLYTLICAFFAGLFIYGRIQYRKMKNEEWLPIVNEKGEVTGKATRKACHSGSRMLHPVIHLHIVNKHGEIFLQKRSMKKDLLPGYWDTAVGGHIGVNEKIEDALKREAFEELGITDFEAQYTGNYIWESPTEKELVFSFLCRNYDKIKIDNDEVDEGRFWSKKEIEQGIKDNVLTPNFIHEYERFLKEVKGTG